MAEIAVTGTFNVEKADSERQMLFGWFNVAASADGALITDSHDEQITPEDLEDAAYNFVLKARASGEDHNGLETDAVLIESVMFTDEKLTAMAMDPFTGHVNKTLLKALHDHMPRGWWGGFHVPDEEAWERAKTGKDEFSIEGMAMSDG